MNHAPPLWRSRNLVPMQNSESPRRDPETTSPVASPLLGNLTLVLSTKCSGPFAAAEEVEVAAAELPAGLVSSPPQAARAIAAPPPAPAPETRRDAALRFSGLLASHGERIRRVTSIASATECVHSQSLETSVSPHETP